MNHHLDDEDDDLQGRTNEREITLSTSTVLGIFFCLALVCALFFGFGYNMGRKSVKPIATDASGNSSSTTDFSAFKPAAGSPAAASTPASVPIAAPITPAEATDASSAPATASSSATTNPVAAPISAQPSPATPTAVNHATPAVAAGPVAQGEFVVQIAAVSHQEDANLLVGALKQRGYTVTARTSPQDKLIHIQVGPFNNRKDADAMRQRLLTDGYNAIVK